MKNFKGSNKDPFFYLGIASLILFGLVSFGSSIFIPSLKSGGFSFSAAISQNFIQSKDQLPFLSQEIKKTESPELSLIQESILVGISPPTTISPQVLGGLIGSSDEFLFDEEKEITEYTVQSGDNLLGIAENFSISLNTLLWVNDLNKNSIIRPGQKLIILPVSGVIHHVKSGDTLTEIAQKYKGEVEEILVFNELSNKDDIFIGDILIIPNGIMPAPVKKYVAPSIPLANSYFICPIALPCKITYGLHWYNAIDFSHGKCEEPIYAAAGGEVQKVKYGWNRGVGTYLTILHPNGVVTLYSHLAKVLVSPGEQVSQGQIIALMGGKPGTFGAGNSTGCHLHFEVRGAKNPFLR